MTKLTTFTTVEELASAIARELYAIHISNLSLSIQTSANEVAPKNDVVKSIANAHHPKDKELILQITNQLHKYGIPEHILGYNYIRYGLYLCYKGESTLTPIVKVFYPDIAKHFETAPNRVERAIRHAIHVANASGSEIFKEKFPNGAPSNKFFISALIDELIVKNSDASA